MDGRENLIFSCRSRLLEWPYFILTFYNWYSFISCPYCTYGCIGKHSKKKDSKSQLNGFSPLLSAYESKWPLVIVIVPAYNEQVNAIRTVNSLLAQDYPQLEIIFVDDGSKDDTYAKVGEHFITNPKVQVYTKSNGGKASALNFGIQKSNGDFVVCIDADTQLKPMPLQS